PVGSSWEARATLPVSLLPYPSRTGLPKTLRNRSASMSPKGAPPEHHIRTESSSSALSPRASKIRSRERSTGGVESTIVTPRSTIVCTARSILLLDEITKLIFSSHHSSTTDNPYWCEN